MPSRARCACALVVCLTLLPLLSQIAFAQHRLRELRGSIALADKRGAEAVKELAGANQQDPKVLYLTALAFRESGDTRQAAAYAKKAAGFNGLAFNYADVRAKAAMFTSPATD